MKVACKVMMVIALCAGLTQALIAEKINIAKVNKLTYKRPWSYKLLTKATATSDQISSEPKKFNKKNATITFDANNDEVIVQVLTDNTNNPGSNITIKRGNLTPYKNQGIAVDINGKTSLIDKNEAPFAPTKKVAVQKRNSDGEKWTIRSQSPINQENYQSFEYGSVDIKNSTNPGRGLEVPKNKEFDLNVSKGKGTQWITTEFTADQAKNMKKIILDTAGNATAE